MTLRKWSYPVTKRALASLTGVILLFAIAEPLYAAPKRPVAPPVAPPLHVVPIAPALPATIPDIVQAIGKRYHVALVACMPAYPVDATKAASASDTSQAAAISRLANALDGHVETLPGPITCVVPNFRVDMPSAPLVPRVRGVVRASNGLAAAFDLIPPDQWHSALQAEGVSLADISPGNRADMKSITIDAHPFDDVLFEGKASHPRAVAFKPEFLVNLRYGTTRIGWYDAWEQRNNDDVRWEMDATLDRARAAWKPAVAVATREPALGELTVAVKRNRLTVPDLAWLLSGGGPQVIVDHAIADRSVALSLGPYRAQALYSAVERCLRLRTLAIADTSAPGFVLTAKSTTDDDRLVSAAVDREIVSTWSPLVAAAEAEHATYIMPFGYGLFSGFAKLRYGELNAEQKAQVDKYLSTLPGTLSDEDRSRLNLTFRPGVLAEGHYDTDGKSLVQQIATVYVDSEP